MSATEETLALLKSIDASLKALVVAANRRAASGGGALAVADDRDLDSQYGDEPVKLNPRDWTGDPMKGRPMSQCPPEFLDLLASAHDYFAKKNEGKVTDKGKPKSDFEKRSASRARGWAARLRSGWTAPKASADPDASDGGFGGASDFGTSDGYGDGNLDDAF